MRENVDLEGFGDGFKAFAWVHYYTKIDDLRKLAADMGINTAHLKKKTELIDAIVSMEVAEGSQDPETE